MAEHGTLTYYQRRLEGLKQVRHSWEGHWQELARNILPDQMRYLQDTGSVEFGGTRNNFLVDGTAGHYAELATIGLFNGLTPKQMPWMRLVIDNQELSEYPPVAEWLHDVSNKILQVFAVSNFYETIFNFDLEELIFGTAGFYIDASGPAISFVPLSIGEYWIETDLNGEVDTCYRQFYATPRQLAGYFGEDKLSPGALADLNGDKQDKYLKCWHAVEERKEYEPGERGKPVPSKKKRFASVYWEDAATDFLSVSGYDEFPFLIVPWSRRGNNVYGYSPAMKALPDILALQVLQEDKYDLIAKMADPPMKVPNGCTDKLDLRPGAINPIDMTGGDLAVGPLFEVQGNALTGVHMAVEDLRNSIREHFYVDFLMMFTEEARSGVTATEIMERKSEKLTVVTSFASRMERMLDKCVQAAFKYLLEHNMVVPMPQELLSAQIEIKYQSAIAQAQQATYAGVIDTVAMSVAQLAQLDPSVIHKLNSHQIIDEKVRLLGAPPNIVRSDDEVAAILEQAQQQAQQAQMMEMMQQGAGMAKDLSAPVDQGSILGRAGEMMQEASNAY